MIPRLSIPFNSANAMVPLSPPATDLRAPSMTVVGFVAQYYELTLRVRLREGKWLVVLLGPNGLLITHDANYASEAEAERVAVDLAQQNLHQEKHDGRPMLAAVDWQPA